MFLAVTVPDTPPSVGLPEVEGTRRASTGTRGGDFTSAAIRLAFRNKYIWLVALANFFVYTVRFAVLDWGPTLLTEVKGFKLTHAGWCVAAFEVSGLAGSILAGWLTDRFLGGRCIRACFIYMGLAGISLLLFWKLPHPSLLSSTLLLSATGFFIYGPQCLVGIAAANLATKHAAATAVGLTGLFAYASTTLSGVGLGKLVEARGWDAGFTGLMIAATIATLLFALGWKAKAHGYDG